MRMSGCSYFFFREEGQFLNTWRLATCAGFGVIFNGRWMLNAAGSHLTGKGDFWLWAREQT